MIKQYFALFLKGMGMGAANVIPGVSGGTIALITGIFERLIDAIKSFNLAALKLLFRGRIKELVKHIDLFFLITVFFGAVVAVFSVAIAFEYLFENYPVFIWSYFFGLVLASVYFVGKQVEKYNFSSIASFIVGTAIAVMISVLSPASENDAMFYLFLCGVVAACSMILPGLSGSFVLILMGNYQLVVIDAVNNLDIKILIPVFIGAVVGIIAFSHLLSMVFKKYRDQTIGTLTGFVFGSVIILWPWKEQLFETFGDKTELVGYNWLIPEINTEFFVAMGIILFGVFSIWFVEYLARKKEKGN
jgi:putative membrane protein